jgi:tRNA-dihydrouridine synthase A
MPIAIAPMIDWTDRHYRFFMRQITRCTTLYTEMITTNAILHGNRDYLIGYSECENPLTLQLGGNDPADLATCAQIAEDWGYSEVNLNVGCPSDRVQKGCFGLSLMNDPETVAKCIGAMKNKVNIPVSVKCRIGVDDNDSYEALSNFIKTQVDTGVDHICIHARKGWLNGLSPKENRTIPPLMYDTVYKIKSDFPALRLGINGGITDIAQIQQHLEHIDYTMIGREAYHNPFFFSEVDHIFYNETSINKNRVEVIESLYPYIEKKLAEGIRLGHMTRHYLGLFHGQKNGKLWRQYLSTHATNKAAGIEVVQQALELVR